MKEQAIDSALILRKSFEHGEAFSEIEISELLKESKLVEKLTRDYEDSPFFNIFRLICLSEIPFIEQLPYTQKIIDFISNNLAADEGFSYNGQGDCIVPCYNAMLLEAYTRLQMAKSNEAQNTLDWIKRYQVFERNQRTSWRYGKICKHGGCMKATPCYIGIGKTVRALITYAKYIKNADSHVEQLIEQGIVYMLKHNMYQSLSNQQCISKYIDEIMFPQAYMLSLTDLVYIVNERNLWWDQRTIPLKNLLEEKQVGSGQWKIEYIYSHKGYKAFETKRNSSKWINYLYNLNK